MLSPNFVTGANAMLFAKSLLVTALAAVLPTATMAQAPVVDASSSAAKAIWQAGRNSVWLVSCANLPDVGKTSVAIEARRGDQAVRAAGCYPSNTFVSVLWGGEPGLAGPDVMLLGQSGGSAACGDVVAVTFNDMPVFHTLPNCPAEEVSVVVVGDIPTFDAYLGLRFNGADGADVRAGRIAVGVYGGGFRPNLTMMTAESLTAHDRQRTESVITKDLHHWAKSLSDGPAGSSTPDTVEALLNLILSGRADQARALLFEAGRIGAGPAFKAKAFWDDFCLALVSHPLWKQFNLDRLRYADLVVRSAPFGLRGRAGRDYLPISEMRK